MMNSQSQHSTHRNLRGSNLQVLLKYQRRQSNRALHTKRLPLLLLVLLPLDLGAQIVTAQTPNPSPPTSAALAEKTASHTLVKNDKPPVSTTRLQSLASGEPSFIKRAIRRTLRLAARMVSALTPRERESSSRSKLEPNQKSRLSDDYIENSTPRWAMRTELAGMPLPEQLMRRLHLLIKYQRTENWAKQYDLLSPVVTQGRTKEEHSKRLKRWYGLGFGDVLVDFVPKSFSVHNPSLDHGEWTLFGCATLRQKSGIVKRYASASAYREKGDWYFSPIGVITAIDGDAKKCTY